MHKLSLPLLALTLSTICPTVKASFHINEDKLSATIKYTYPKIETKRTSETNDKEVELLHQGVKSFAEGQYQDAYNTFMQTLSDYGSPLAYLYAGALTDNDNLGIRYISISLNALDCNAISQSSFDEHLQYIKDKGFIDIEG